MLPLHRQNTAALQLKVSGQAILQKLTVFVKQADMKNLSNSSKEMNTHIQHHNEKDLLITQ